MSEPGLHPDDVRQDLDEIGHRMADLDRAQAELMVDLDETIRRARAAGIHGAEIAERTHMSRAWLYRRFRSALGLA